MDNKKERSRNFTPFEKNLLPQLVEKYFHIIENKKTDGVSVADKNAAWEKIAAEFNSSAQAGSKTAKQLASLWKALKMKSKSNLYKDKKNMYLTGGGTFTPESSEVDEKVAALLRPQFTPLENPMDSSAIYYNEVDNTEKKPTEAQFVEQSSLPSVPDGPSTSSNEVSRSPLVEEGNAGEIETIQAKTVRQKSHFFRKTSGSRKRGVDALVNRTVQRKNFKDQCDDDLKKVKMEVISIERRIKEKEERIKELEMLEVQERQIRNEALFKLQEKKAMLEIKLLEKELQG